MKNIILLLFLSINSFASGAAVVVVMNNKEVALEKAQYCILEKKVLLKEKGQIVKAIEKRELCFDRKEDALIRKKEIDEAKPYGVIAIIGLLVFLFVFSVFFIP